MRDVVMRVCARSIRDDDEKMDDDPDGASADGWRPAIAMDDAIAIGRAREGVVTTRASTMCQMKYVSSTVRSVEDARGGVRAVGRRTRRWMRSVYPS